MENGSYLLFVRKFHWNIRDMQHFGGWVDPLNTVKRIFEHGWMTNEDVILVESLVLEENAFIIGVDYIQGLFFKTHVMKVFLRQIRMLLQIKLNQGVLLPLDLQNFLDIPKSAKQVVDHLRANGFIF